MPKFVLDPPPDGLRCSLEVDDDGDLNIIINNHLVMWVSQKDGRLVIVDGQGDNGLPGIQFDSEGCIQLCDEDRRRIAEQWNAEHKPTQEANS